jgi:hypothetical protein
VVADERNACTWRLEQSSTSAWKNPYTSQITWTSLSVTTRSLRQYSASALLSSEEGT